MGKKSTEILLVLIHSFINTYKWNTYYTLSTVLSTERYKLVNTTVTGCPGAYIPVEGRHTLFK